jgi:hypothetical protein
MTKTPLIAGVKGMKINAMAALPISLSLSIFMKENSNDAIESIVMFDQRNPNNADVYMCNNQERKTISLNVIINEEGIIQIEEFPKIQAVSNIPNWNFVSEQDIEKESSQND